MNSAKKAATLIAATLALAFVLACADPSPLSPGSATPGRGPTTDAVNDLTEVQAPIETVEIWLIGGSDAPAQLVIVSGIPDGCVRYKETVVSQESGVITSTVANLVPADPNTMCIQVYGTNQSHTDLSEEFDACDTYTVVVNDETHAVQPTLHRAVGSEARRLLEVVDPSTLCGASEEPTAPGAREHVPAPIEGFEINVAESFPVQYFVVVSVGLPNACYDFGGHEVTVDGTTVRISVTNLAPADPNAMCAEIYRTVDVQRPLGSSFEPGTEYTVEVNRETAPLNPGFSSAPLPSTGSDAAYGSPFTITGGGSTNVGIDSLVIVLESIEDSRCPANVVCIWQGLATITLSATLRGESLGQRELTLESERIAPETGELGDFLITCNSSSLIRAPALGRRHGPLPR